MDKIDIYCFKKSGKYYTSEFNVEVPKGLMLFHDEFENFVRANCGVTISSSHEFKIVVIDNKDNKNFYTYMFE